MGDSLEEPDYLTHRPVVGRDADQPEFVMQMAHKATATAFVLHDLILAGVSSATAHRSQFIASARDRAEVYRANLTTSWMDIRSTMLPGLVHAGKSERISLAT